MFNIDNSNICCCCTCNFTNVNKVCGSNAKGDKICSKCVADSNMTMTSNQIKSMFFLEKPDIVTYEFNVIKGHITVKYIKKQIEEYVNNKKKLDISYAKKVEKKIEQLNTRQNNQKLKQDKKTSIEKFVTDNKIYADLTCSIKNLDVDLINEIKSIIDKYIQSNIMTFEEASEKIYKINEKIVNLRMQKDTFSKLLVEILKNIITDDTISKATSEPIEEVRLFLTTTTATHTWNGIESYIFVYPFDVTIFTLNSKETILKSECYKEIIQTVLDKLSTTYRRHRIDTAIINYESEETKKGRKIVKIGYKKYNFTKYIETTQSMYGLRNSYILYGIKRMKKSEYDFKTFDDLIEIFKEMYYYEHNTDYKRKITNTDYYNCKINDMKKIMLRIKCQIVEQLDQNELFDAPKNVILLSDRIKAYKKRNNIVNDIGKTFHIFDNFFNNTTNGATNNTTNAVIQLQK